MKRSVSGVDRGIESEGKKSSRQNGTAGEVGQLATRVKHVAELSHSADRVGDRPIYSAKFAFNHRI